MIDDSAVAVRRIGPDGVGVVLSAAALFDAPPTAEWTEAFLRRPGWHLLVAFAGDVPVGFVSGIEIGHPDKQTELLLYELGVDQAHRRRGIGRQLVNALRELAAERGCRGMWVPIDPANAAAVATYRSAGAAPPQTAAIMEWALD
jgi:ribosomal protein S18 acetylase RimI-like enzyme